MCHRRATGVAISGAAPVMASAAAAEEAVLTQLVRDAALQMTALMTKAAVMVMMVMMRLDDGGDDDAGSTRSTTSTGKSAINVDATAFIGRLMAMLLLLLLPVLSMQPEPMANQSSLNFWRVP